MPADQEAARTRDIGQARPLFHRQLEHGERDTDPFARAAASPVQLFRDLALASGIDRARDVRDLRGNRPDDREGSALGLEVLIAIAGQRRAVHLALGLIEDRLPLDPFLGRCDLALELVEAPGLILGKVAIVFWMFGELAHRLHGLGALLKKVADAGHHFSKSLDKCLS